MVRSLLAETMEFLRRFRHDFAFRELVMTSWRSFLIRMAGVLTGFLVTWITARFFSAEALGVVSICIGMLSVASVFTKMGHDIALMRFISNFFSEGRMASIRAVYLTSARVVVPVGIMMTLLFYLSADWLSVHVFHKPNLAAILRWNSFLLLPLTYIQIHSECLRGMRKIEDYTFLQTTAVSTFALAGLILVYFAGASGDMPVIVQFICIALTAVLSLYRWMKVSGSDEHSPVETVTPRSLRTTAGPMFTTTIMQLLMSWSGQLILAVWQPASMVGIYNALVRVSVFTNITILAINGLMMTRFATAFHSGDSMALRRHSSEATRLIFLTSLPLFAALFLFPNLILAVFGPAFRGFERELLVLVFGQFAVVCSGLPGQLLNMTNRQSILRNVAVVSAAVNVLCCLFLIPSFGMIGACWAQFVGTFVWTGLCIVAARKEFGFITLIGCSKK